MTGGVQPRYFQFISGMREIVSLQVGQCGVQVAQEFWRTISDEHGIDAEGAFRGSNSGQLRHVEVYFDEADSSRFVPRSVFVDLDTGACDNVAAGPLGKLFYPDNFVKGTGGAGNNWAKGYRTLGTELVEEAMDVLRAEAEACDRLQGFQVTHCTGGGTGSGLGCLLIERLNEEYPDRVMAAYSVVPSAKTSDTVVEPYNAMMAFSHLLDSTGLTYVLDNEALYNIAVRTLKLSKPTYGDLNALIANTMSGTTCSLRFPGQLNCDLRKLSVNMVPFPRLHFFTVGFSPLYSPNSTHYRKLTVPIITKQAFDPRNQMCAANPRNGRYLTCACMYRGKLSMHEIEKTMLGVKQRDAKYFVDWLPDHVMASLCDTPPTGLKASATFVGNTTAIGSVWLRIADQFSTMFKKKAFLHWYTGEGMEESEFTEAELNLRDLISEYQQAGDSAAHGAGEHDEDEHEEEEGDARAPSKGTKGKSAKGAKGEGPTGAGLDSSNSQASVGSEGKGEAWRFKTVQVTKKVAS